MNPDGGTVPGMPYRRARPAFTLRGTWRQFALATGLAALALPACTPANSESVARAAAVPQGAAHSAPPQGETTGSAPAIGDTRAPADPTPPGAKPPPRPDHEQPFYDLARHVDHAELRQGRTLVVDHGVPSAAKYTLGGWRTRVARSLQVDDTSAALARGTRADYLVPVDFDGAGALALRVRAPRDGRLTVYLDGETIGHIKGDKKRFGVHRFDLTAEQLGRGEHSLRLRSSGLGRLAGHRTSAAVDWIRVGPAGAPLSDQSPPTPALLHPPNDSAALRIPDGHALGYALRVPAGARLRGSVSGQGQLSVAVQRDDGSMQPLAKGLTGEVDVDLSAHANQVVRLDLSSTGSLMLHKPRLVTLRPQTRQQDFKPARHVLIYLIDTLRADHLRAFNPNTRVQTPGMDLLAKAATVFTAAHTQENWTKPSVATLLSSLMPWEHHATTTEAVVPKTVELLPQILRDRGYHTGAFIANGYVSDRFGFKRGWDTYRNYIREGRKSRAEFLAADVLKWLDDRPEKLPFFLYVHSIDPHVPYRPNKQFLPLYDSGPYDGPVNFSHDFALLEKVKSGRLKLNARDRRRLEALYDAEISYHDVHFAAIMRALEQRGLADDTLVVVTADHGEEFWDHGSVGHGHNVYQELLNIPMIVHLPGTTERSARVDSSVGLVDVMPTVLQAIDEDVPEGLSGRSFLPELLGQTADAPPVAVSGFMDGWRTVVVDGVKLIQRTEKRMMVHDLRTDPDEQVDLAAQRPLTLRYLRGQLGLALAKSRPRGKRGKRRHKKQDTTIDPETEAQLRALGYVGSSRR